MYTSNYSLEEIEGFYPVLEMAEPFLMPWRLNDDWSWIFIELYQLIAQFLPRINIKHTFLEGFEVNTNVFFRHMCMKISKRNYLLIEILQKVNLFKKTNFSIITYEQNCSFDNQTKMVFGFKSILCLQNMLLEVLF